jgi:pyridoxal phosphate-dependent aminotransferase EpsN
MSRIYLSPPDVGRVERELLVDAFDSGWIAPLGPHVDAFEAELARFVGVKHAVALASGTAGLHLALLNLGIGPGDEVFTSSLTFAATANAICYVGATPVFIDSDAASWNMDPDLVAEELDRRARAGRLPKAVLTVDLYGQPARYDALAPLCERFGIPLVEDAAEALGATYQGRHAGAFGRVGVFSFNGNKIITTSGGGMLVTDDETMAARARHLATQAREPAPHYEHKDVGYNYRLSNLLAAVGRAQLQSLPRKIERRRAIFTRYQQELGELPGIAFMPELGGAKVTRWLTCITVDPQAFGCDRERIREALAADDIEARPVWKPMHLQPVFADFPHIGGRVSEDLFRRGLCLPSGSSLSEADQTRVIQRVLEARSAAMR